MNNNYYIEFYNNKYVLNIDCLLILRKVYNQNRAKEILSEEDFKLDSDFLNFHNGNVPIIITNDDLMNLKYKWVFSENEFYKLCQFDFDKYGLSKVYAAELLNHFEKIKNDNYKEAKLIEFSDTILDEYNYQEYLSEDTEWETSDWVWAEEDNEDVYITPL